MRIQTVSMLFVLMLIGQMLVFIQSQAPDAGAAAPSPVKLIRNAQNPVLSCGPAGSWDGRTLELTSMIYDGTNYKMYYMGGYNLFSPWAIGVATSTDGVTWTKYSGNPIIRPGPAGSWDSVMTVAARVLKDGNTYKMWYAGYDGNTYRTGYATSADGFSWAKYGGNPLDTGPGAVLKENDEYKTWFGMSGGIGYATSSDGLAWTEYPGNPVLSFGGPGAFDSQGGWTGSVINYGGKYRMWYTGWNGQFHAIGYADSPDEVSWTQCDRNPILTGTGAGWERDEVQDICAVFNGTGYQMWYGGVNQGANPWSYQIGYAEGWNLDLNPPTATLPMNNTWVNKAKPSFSWNFNDTNVKDRQAAYQVELAVSENFSTLKYDSGKVTSSSTTHSFASAIPDGIYYWRVRVWTPYDEMSDWSAPEVVGIDTVAPLNPVNLTSTTHQPGVWSPDNIVNISWALPPHGDFSGYDGFSISWDLSPGSLPEKSIELGGDVSNISSSPLSNGLDQYFHIRAVDLAGNWASGAATFGPIDIDASSPTNPSIESVSHESRVWNSNDTIDISYSGADGGTSGLAGYDIVWDARSKTIPSGPVNVTPDITNVTSPPLADGNSWYFHLRTMNNAGTWATDTVHAGPFFIDATPPNISLLSIDNGASSTSNPLASLTLSATDPVPGSGMANMRFSLDGSQWTVWEPFNEKKTLNLTGPDGNRNVYLQVQDQTGNIPPTAIAGILLDTHAPSDILLRINGGAAYSNSSSVVLAMNATDYEPGTGLADMAFSFNNLIWGAWGSFAMQKNMTLPPGDGMRTVFVKVRDGVGNIGEIAEGDIQVDTASPQALTIVINSGADATNNLTVRLTLSASDPNPPSGLGEMSFSADGTLWTSWEPYATSRNYTFPGDGVRSVYFRVRDRAMNTADPVSASILVDTSLPKILTITVAHAGQNNATIVVTTDEPCKLVLNYGTGKSFKYSDVWDNYTTAHVFEVAKLGAGTTYHFKITATDRGGNPATVSADQKFSTKAAAKTPVGALPLMAVLAVAILLMRKKRGRPEQ